MALPVKHTGPHAELRACAWLLEQGYEVFRNVSSCGRADLVAWHPDTGEVRLVDVTVSRSKPLDPEVWSLHVTAKHGCRWGKELVGRRKQVTANRNADVPVSIMRAVFEA